MSAEIRRDGRLFSPVLVCDDCDEEIRSIRRGRVLWNPVAVGDRYQPFFVHDRCVDHFQERTGISSWEVADLGGYLKNFMCNVGG